jgi:sensor histidine kinase regulating citrate/malate metabolism
MSEKQERGGMSGQEAEFSPYYDNLRHCLHELAQPLATVTGLVDLLLLELDEQDRIFQEVQLISQQLEKVMQIVGEIRRMTREAVEREMKALKPSQAPLS